jgi:protein SMG7
MTIPMDSNSENTSRDKTSRERVQRLYSKNVELENNRRKAAQARVPSDPNSWQQMRENYEAIILEDHAFSEKHEIEHALWQLHYRRIEELRAHYNAALSSSSSQSSSSAASPNEKGQSQTSQGPNRVAKIRSQFKTFLSEATGFYHDLMVKIRAKYGLPLSYVSDDSGFQNGFSKNGNNRSVDVKKGLISCHRCLIYLGDLARYKGLYGDGESKSRDFAAASSYYMQASSVWPSSGNPHHQLAILASYSGDEFVAVYRYFRSLAVDNPFTTARDNLIIAFEKNRQAYTQFIGEAKAATVKPPPLRMTGKGRGKGAGRAPVKESKAEEIAVKEKIPAMSEILKAFGIRFVRLNGILFTRTSLETFNEVYSCAKNDLLLLLSSGPDEDYNFGPNSAECSVLIVRLVAILVFTVHNVNRETENQSYAEILQRSVVLKNAFSAIFEFIGHILERCVQLKDPSSSYLMPGILIFVEWLACRHDVAVNAESDERESKSRSFFWKNCIALFNKILSSGLVFNNEDDDDACFYNMSPYEEGETVNQLALTEDFELRGFTPLVPAQLILDFSRKPSFGNEKKARVQRIISAGKALANSVQTGQDRFYFDSKMKKFMIGVEPEINIQQESLNLNMNLVEPNADVYEDEDEEDEVILFKPSIIEKTEMQTSNILPPQPQPPISLAEISANYLKPLQQTNSKWLAEEQSSDLNFSDFQDQSADFRHPYQIPETLVPSKYDSVMLSGNSMLTSSAMSVGSKKNPVSRPIRHFGPPPGFNTVPNKPSDDYSWLDGHKFPSVTKPAGFNNNSLYNNNYNYNHSISKMNDPSAVVSFPFPGKQVATLQPHMENQNGWQEYQFSEHLKLQLQLQLQNGNQQPVVSVPNQYHGQTLWEGRYV